MKKLMLLVLMAAAAASVFADELHIDNLNYFKDSKATIRDRWGSKSCEYDAGCPL
jgi:hypothetical protein